MKRVKTYRIKKLVWTEKDWLHMTDGADTFYVVAKLTSPYAGNEWHITWTSVYTLDKGSIDLGSLDEAKAWVERDYERRVKFNLEEVTDA